MPLDRAALETVAAAGRAAWPGVEVALDALAADLARRGVDDVRERCAADLYVAAACARGDGGAIAAVEERCFVELEGAARRTGASAAQADDLRGELRRVLFVDEPARPAAIATFAGRGDLRAYVRVVATRALVRVVQRGRREVALDDAMLDSVVTDPALAHLRAAYRDEVAAALRIACAALPPEPRALLRYSLVERWSIDRIGALLGIHRANAARRLAAARVELGELVRAHLAASLAIAPDEVDSIVRLVQSRVEITFERALSAS